MEYILLIISAVLVLYDSVGDCARIADSLGIPFITLVGRRGGSPLAVSVIHALCGLAVGKGEGEKP